jgi:predicted Zn-dependent protease
MTWIDKGTIANLAYDRYWAAKTGKEPTPGAAGDGGGGRGGGGFGFGGANRLILDGTDAPLEKLIASVDRGLLITQFWYIRFVNQQTRQHTD